MSQGIKAVKEIKTFVENLQKEHANIILTNS